MRGNPGKVKSITTFVPEGGEVLESDALAVTFHAVLPGPSADNLAVDVCPRPVGGRSSGRVMLVERFDPGCSLETLRESVVGWSGSETCRTQSWFHLPLAGAEAQSVHDAVSSLLACGAIEGKSVSEGVDVQTEPWATLLNAGHVKHCDVDAGQVVGDGVADAFVPVAGVAAVQLSSSGLRSLIPGALCHTCEKVCSPRLALPLADLTAWELGMMLRDRGWEWKLFFPAGLRNARHCFTRRTKRKACGTLLGRP